MSMASLATRDRLFRLYDPQELLAMESKVASGYVVLMGGYPTVANTKTKPPMKKSGKNDTTAADAAAEEESAEAQPKLDRGAVNLAFMALTDGNVVDACFGIKAHVSADAATRRVNQAAKMSNDAKNLLNEAVRSSAAVREVAVRAYGKAFQIVIQYNDDCKHLNFITRCYRQKPIRQKAENALYEAFKPLNEAIDAAT